METKITIEEICFGLNRATDERSLAIFLKKFNDNELLNTLIPRLSNEEITATLDFLTKLMRNHLQKQEYHNLFLGNSKL